VLDGELIVWDDARGRTSFTHLQQRLTAGRRLAVEAAGHPELARQGTNERGQHGPVRPRQPRPTDLTTQHGDLVAQHQQLGGHRRIAASRPR
jgi:hypothetical protein